MDHVKSVATVKKALEIKERKGWLEMNSGATGLILGCMQQKSRGLEIEGGALTLPRGSPGPRTLQ